MLNTVTMSLDPALAESLDCALVDTTYLHISKRPESKAQDHIQRLIDSNENQNLAALVIGRGNNVKSQRYKFEVPSTKVTYFTVDKDCTNEPDVCCDFDSKNGRQMVKELLINYNIVLIFFDWSTFRFFNNYCELLKDLYTMIVPGGIIVSDLYVELFDGSINDYEIIEPLKVKVNKDKLVGNLSDDKYRLFVDINTTRSIICTNISMFKELLTEFSETYVFNNTDSSDVGEIYPFLGIRSPYFFYCIR